MKTITEVAEILDTPRPTIVSWVKNGKIPRTEIIKKGNMLLISESHVQKMAQDILEEIETKKEKLTFFLFEKNLLKKQQQQKEM